MNGRQVHVIRRRGLGESMLLIGPSTQIVIFASLRAKGPVRVGHGVDAVASATGAFDDAYLFGVTHVRVSLNSGAQSQFK